MEDKKYIAVDIGASSGRVCVVVFGEKFEILEQNRFTIEVQNINGKQRTNIQKLVKDIKEGIAIGKVNYPDAISIGVDTWAVDFAAIDKEGNLVDNPMFYRDQTFVDELERYANSKPDALKELYMDTGLQIQPFNTMFQLNVLEKNYDVSKVDQMLMLPDYINFVLTGKKYSEPTNFSTTQLYKLNGELTADHGKFFSQAAADRKLGTYEGIEVVSVASHDTASAYASIPVMDDEAAFLSSGTWSLLGVPVDGKVVDVRGYESNFSNERNFDGTYRFQKNILGMWVINNLMKDYNLNDFEEIERISFESNCKTVVNINDERFFDPKSMSEEIINYCKEEGLEVPVTPGDVFRVAYNSLADSYNKTIEEIETITGKTIKKFVIVGGGAKSKILNELIKEIMDREIYIIPEECTIIGNALVQAIVTGLFKDLKEGHQYIKEKLNVERIK